MCFKNSQHKVHTLVNIDEDTNICFDGEDSDICAVGPGTNDNVAYASIDTNTSTCNRYMDNVTYNGLIKQATELCTTVKYSQEYCRIAGMTITGCTKIIQMKDDFRMTFSQLPSTQTDFTIIDVDTFYWVHK